MYELYVSDRGLKQILNAAVKREGKPLSLSWRKKSVTTLKTVRVRKTAIWQCHMPFQSLSLLITTRAQMMSGNRGVDLYKTPCLMFSQERVFPVENQFRWLRCGDVGTWAVARRSQAENGFECGFGQLLFHFWLDRNLPEKVFPFVTTLIFLHFKESCITFSSPPWHFKCKKGSKGGRGSLQVQSKTWKANLLSKKRFVKSDRFDFIKSKILGMAKPQKLNWKSHRDKYLQLI